MNKIKDSLPIIPKTNRAIKSGFFRLRGHFVIAHRSKRFILESQFDNDDVIISDRRLPSSIVSCDRALIKLRHTE